MIAYSDIRGHLRTGDLVLFNGQSAISSFIKSMQRSEYSHVGMILRTEAGNADFIQLLESTTLSDVPDVVSGRAIRGVQVVPFSERLFRYDGEVAIRLLNLERTPQMLEAVLLGRRDLHGRPYEQRILSLLGAWVDLPWLPEAKPDLSSLFCSELVAEMYQRMGVLPTSPASSEYLPRDFASEHLNTMVRRGQFGKIQPLKKGWQ